MVVVLTSICSLKVITARIDSGRDDWMRVYNIVMGPWDNRGIQL